MYVYLYIYIYVCMYVYLLGEFESLRVALILVVEGAGYATHFKQLMFLQGGCQLQLIEVGVIAHLLQFTRN